ncbi:MAG TPA: hypothetical protein VF491_17890, partial [Vicinamibacterales bacterium]
MDLSTRNRLVIAGLSAGFAVSCASTPAGRAVSPSYDAFSGHLIQLSADQDGDGRIDQWTYLDGTRPLRGEKDSDRDGRIDRWEYFGPGGELVSVGTSRRNDGVEDTWTWVERVNVEGRVDVSSTRDRHIDRREYFVGDVLSRVELDTNADGRIDRWDRYENRVLREVQFDTTFQAARADRRLLYDPQGRFLAAEADDDRDGHFARL